MLPVLAMALQVAAAGWPWTGDASPPAHVLKLGQATVIEGRWGGKPARVRIEQTLVPNCRGADWLHGAVADRQDRCTRLSRIEVVVGGKPMTLSSSGYADLGGVDDVVVRFAPTRMIIYMRGPDGPDYYGATLEFDHSDIVRRKLDLADGGNEVTTYRPATSAGP